MPEANHPRTFEEILMSGERRRLERTLALVRAAALAVDALHARQVVHGSLEPSSFQVDGEDRVTLLPPAGTGHLTVLPPAGTDHVAHLPPASTDHLALRPPGSTVATEDPEEAPPLGARPSRPPPFPSPRLPIPADPAPGRAYWSPQRQAGEPARQEDDLYALGLIASELFASHRSPKIEAVLRAHLSWAPSERFASGAELAQELDRAAAPPRANQEPAWAAARRVAQARAAHRLALATPPTHRPRRRVQPAPIPSHPILRRSNYPDMPLAGRWVAIVVVVLCSVYLFPLYFMLFQRG